MVGYSISKSLSLPGERIGYVAVNPACEDAETMISTIEIFYQIMVERRDSLEK